MTATRPHEIPPLVRIASGGLFGSGLTMLPQLPTLVFQYSNELLATSIGATVVAALWGIYVWKEFQEAPKETGKTLNLMLLCYILGLILIIAAR